MRKLRNAGISNIKCNDKYNIYRNGKWIHLENTSIILFKNKSRTVHWVNYITSTMLLPTKTDEFNFKKKNYSRSTKNNWFYLYRLKESFREGERES